MSESFVLHAKSMLRDELSIDNQWEKIVESLKEVAQEVVGYNRKKKGQWISESTWYIIDQRAEAKIFAKLTVIIVYAPTNDTVDQAKDDFYRVLSNVVAKPHWHNIVTLCGDFNAKVRRDASYAPAILGKHGLGGINDNGVRLIDFCATHELIVSVSWFPHKQIHKYTWNSPDGVTRNEIDHILIAKHRRRCLEDVGTFQGADCYSDNQLVVAAVSKKV
ncbi:craniofacial development protein 2-like [Artemia franciscana]|uniref:craniofacial development protein 2-like n=1 Tax=Artemia franciscana TaxID=6661 RepID=UPI0032D9CB03